MRNQLMYFGIVLLCLTQYVTSVLAAKENEQHGVSAASTTTSKLSVSHIRIGSATAKDTILIYDTSSSVQGEQEASTSISDPSTETDITSTTTVDLSTTSTTPGNTEEPDYCELDNCTSTNSCTFVKSDGCIRLREGLEDRIFSYTIIAPSESSLIYVEMDKQDGDLLPNSAITIKIDECGEIKETWLIKESKQIQKQSYISTGYNLTLHISTDGSWTNATINYWEVEFRTVEEQVDDSLDEGVLVPPSFKGLLRSRPNTNKTYLLTASKSRWNESSVMMTLSYVDLDEPAGDYLLIGAGKSPFAGPDPLFFTGNSTKSTDYYIASDNVYVVFVSKASKRTDKKGFHIKWKRSGIAITKPDEEPDEETISDAVIQSVGICFYNKSFIAEFNRTEDYNGPLQSFRDNLARIANAYARKNKMLEDSVLTASSVVIFRVSAIINPIDDVMPEGGIYAMLTIVHHFDRKTAVFRRKELEDIITEMGEDDKENGYSILGFKVGHCPTNESYFQWYLIAVLLALVSSTVILIVWICSSLSRWRGFPTDKKLSSPGNNVYCKESIRHVQQNLYVTTGFIKPKMKLTDCDGESITLESNSVGQPLSEADDDSEKVIFDQGWLQKKRPSRKELPTSMMNAEVEPKQPFLKTFPTPLPSTGHNRLWTKDFQMIRLFPQISTQNAEHEYDSLVLPDHENETKL